MTKKSVLLIAQVSPLIHGQAIMAAQLASLMATWPNVNLHLINACYSEERSKLGSFSLLKLLRWVGFLFNMLWCCVRYGVDTLVMTHSFFRGPFLKDSIFVWLGRAFGLEVIMWVHMDPNRLEVNAAPQWLSRYAKKVIQVPDQWIACAPSLIHQWPVAFDRKKLSAICNGIPDPAPPLRMSVNQALRVVYLSSMTEEKGWKELFAVAEILCGQRQDVVFDFYGGPGANESHENLSSTFAQTAFPSRIRWHGELWGEQKIAVLSQADVFCLPSWTEAFPVAILEAMACGLPVIATQVGGIQDAIAQGINGWLYPPRDAIALKNVLDYALNDREKLREIGLTNRQRFLADFSLAAFEAQWKELLQVA